MLFSSFGGSREVSYLDPETIGGTNIYAYCNNNPVMYVDPSGHGLVSILIGIGVSALIGALSGAASYAVGQLISFAVTGKWNWSWGGFLGSVIGGAIGGAVSGIANALGSGVMLGLNILANRFKSISKVLQSFGKIASRLIVMAGAYASGFTNKASSMVFNRWLFGANYTDNQIRENAKMAGRFSLLLSDGSPTSLFNDIEASLSGASSKTIGKIFATELNDNFYDGMSSFLTESYYSIFGFESLVLQFAG